MTLEEFLEEKAEEHALANMHMSCSCSAGHAPCHFCEQSYCLVLDDYLEHWEEQWESGNVIAETKVSNTERYDHAMKGLDI